MSEMDRMTIRMYANAGILIPWKDVQQNEIAHTSGYNQFFHEPLLTDNSRNPA